MREHYHLKDDRGLSRVEQLVLFGGSSLLIGAVLVLSWSFLAL